MSVTVRVSAERGNGVWVLESSNGAVSQVRSLSQAEDEMREAVAYLAGVPVSEVAIVVDVITPEAYQVAARQAERLRADVVAAQEQLAEAQRAAARALVGAGFTYRDAGAVMGISHQRVAQLV
ncbi:MAG: hypothetical protein Q4B08_00895 [Propionibacteriaceae bacterium]|nr:hypothetical protein [Propionibacteriaceae bacterium]